MALHAETWQKKRHIGLFKRLKYKGNAGFLAVQIQGLENAIILSSVEYTFILKVNDE